MHPASPKAVCSPRRVSLKRILRDTGFRPGSLAPSQRGLSSILAGLGSLLWTAVAWAGSGQAISPGPASPLPEPDLQRIEQALPSQALVRPEKARKLLIFDLNVGYGGHPSIKHANEAFRRMGEKTSAFQVVRSQDPSMFLPENLGQFDAVFFNNTVGNLFEDPQLRKSLVDFVYGGGGLMGVHGTTVAFTKWPGAVEDWPEFGILLGGRGANHRESTEHVFIKLDDAQHPLNRVFAGQGFEYRDEFFRVHDTYSRDRVRVLFSIDTAQTDLKQGPAYGNLARRDNDYALAWIRNYGRGRVFYCTIAHNPYVFWDPKMLQFYLGAIQFALGDLPCPTLPSAWLTPAIRAQEQLGWRSGAMIEGDLSIFESIDLAARLRLPYIGVTWGQSINRPDGKPFDDQLGETEMKQLRLKLDQASIRLLSCDVPQWPASPDALRNLFAFSKKMGIEVLSGSPAARDLDRIESLCDEYRIQLALRPLSIKSSEPAWTPQEILRQCARRSARIGAAGHVDEWNQAKINPLDAIRLLKDRLVTFQFTIPPGNSGEKGTVVTQTMETILRESLRLNLKPAMVNLAFRAHGTNAPPAAETSVNALNELGIKIARESGSARNLHLTQP